MRAVVLDIGGVLEVTPSTGWQARWEARLGLAPGSIDTRLRHVYRAGTLGTITLEETERAIEAELGLEPAARAALMNDLWDEYLGSLDRTMARWFAALRPRFRTGLLTNSWVGARERESERYALEELCDAIVYSHEEGMEKPDARFYAIVCERLGVMPSETAFVDDRRVNIEAARALGMRGVLHRGDAAETIAEVEVLLRR